MTMRKNTMLAAFILSAFLAVLALIVMYTGGIEIFRKLFVESLAITLRV